MTRLADLDGMRHRDRALVENFAWLTTVAGLDRETASRRLGFSCWDSLERHFLRHRERVTRAQ